MAVLTGFLGSHAVLEAHAALLPQPDQLCGPFAAYVALHALIDDPPSMLSLAAAAGTAIWPYDVNAWRPAGAPLDRTGWDRLPEAGSPGASGTRADGLADGLVREAGVAVVPVPGGFPDPAARLGTLLESLLESDFSIGVVANVHTGSLGSPRGWDVGHFVVLHGFDPAAGQVGVADTYRELGASGEPPGCRNVAVGDLAAALGAPPGRGLLLLVRPGDELAARDLVGAVGLPLGLWSA